MVIHAESDLANETAVKEKRKRDADDNEASLLVQRHFTLGEK